MLLYWRECCIYFKCITVAGQETSMQVPWIMQIWSRINISILAWFGYTLKRYSMSSTWRSHLTSALWITKHVRGCVSYHERMFGQAWRWVSPVVLEQQVHAPHSWGEHYLLMEASEQQPLNPQLLYNKAVRTSQSPTLRNIIVSKSLLLRLLKYDRRVFLLNICWDDRQDSHTVDESYI